MKDIFIIFLHLCLIVAEPLSLCPIIIVIYGFENQYLYIMQYINFKDFKKVVKSKYLKRKIMDLHNQDPNIIIYYGRLSAAWYFYHSILVLS